MQLETPPSELQEILDRIELTPMGDEELELVRRALAIAEQNDLPGWSYQLRLWFNRSTFRMGDTDALLTSFTKSLAIHDSDPHRFPLEIDEQTHLLFQYKWVAEMLNDSPAYSLAQINGIYADMERRYREAGKSPSGYLQTRFGGACERGELEEAAQYFAELQAAPRDDLSHCEACYRSTAAMYFADRGDSDKALELLEEIFSGQYVCGDEPEYSESQAMHLHLKKGNLDEAKRLHLKSLAAVAQNPEPSGIVVRHVVFCIITGNIERALELVEKNAKLFDSSELNVARQFDSLTLLGVLADALAKVGRGDIPVRGTGSHYYDVILKGIKPASSGADFTAHELTAFVWDRAQEFVELFNARNGNDHYTARMDSRKALLETRIDLPIGIEVFEPEETYALEPAVLELTEPVHYVAAAANELPHNVAGALEFYRAGRAHFAHTDQSSELVDVLFYLLGVDLSNQSFNYEALAAEFEALDLGVMAAAVRELNVHFAQEMTPAHLAAVEEHLKNAVTAHEGLSAGYLALIAAERLVYTSTELANLHLSTALESLPTLPMMQRAAIVMVDLSLRDNEFMEARQALAQAAVLSSSVRTQDIEIASLEARIALFSDKFEDAEIAYDKALSIALAAQDYTRVWPILADLARVYAGNGQAVEAVRALKRALRYAVSAQASDEQIHTINYALGTQLVNAGHPHDALGPLTEVVNWNMDNDGFPESITAALMALGEAAVRAQEFQQAFSAWFFGMNYAEEHELFEPEFGFALRLADFLIESEHPEAPEFAVRAYKLAQRSGTPVQTVNAAKRMATAHVVVAGVDDFSTLDKAVAHLVETGEEGSPEVEITRIETYLHKARLLWRLGKGVESGETALQAVEVAGEIELGEAQFDALVLAGVAFKSAGETSRARQAFEDAQKFSAPGESPYEFAAQQLADL